MTLAPSTSSRSLKPTLSEVSIDSSGYPALLERPYLEEASALAKGDEVQPNEDVRPHKMREGIGSRCNPGVASWQSLDQSAELRGFLVLMLIYL